MKKIFDWVLKLIAERGLVKGERIGVDGSTMEANAALRTILRRDNGETYRAMLTCMAKESGIETPSAEDLARLDRKRKGDADDIERAGHGAQSRRNHSAAHADPAARSRNHADAGRPRRPVRERSCPTTTGQVRPIPTPGSRG